MKKTTTSILKETILHYIRETVFVSSITKEYFSAGEYRDYVLKNLYLHSSMFIPFPIIVMGSISNSNNSFTPPLLSFRILIFDHTSKGNQRVTGYGGIFEGDNSCPLHVYALSYRMTTNNLA